MKSKQKSKKKAKSVNSKWSNKYYVEAYRLAKTGLNNKEIATVLGVSEFSFRLWMKKRATLRWAVQEARVTHETSFTDYVFERLPPELHEIWKELHAFEDEPTALGKIESLFGVKGSKRARQLVFLHALTQYNFNASKALKAVGTSKPVLDEWCDEEEFAALVNQMKWHRAEYYEEALWKGVQAGEPSLVKFANATFNKDRGYTEKIEVEGHHTHQHNVIVLDNLDLPINIKKMILDAIRKRDAIDVESRPLLEDNSNGQSDYLEEIKPKLTPAERLAKGRKIVRRNKLAKLEQEELASNGRVY